MPEPHALFTCFAGNAGNGEEKMAKFLVEDEVGFDLQHIGFPNLGGCMALVLLTDQGLYGFHITPGNSRKAPIFAQFIQNTGPGGNMRRLYGSCYFQNRYAGKINGMGSLDQWKDEMKNIANAIGFQGKVSGYDLSTWNSHSDKTMLKVTGGKTHKGTNYLEYYADPSGQKCRIFYKKMDKMQLTPAAFVTTDQIRKILGNNLVNPVKNTVTASADIVTTTGNKGKLHEVGFYGRHSFDIP